jgi:hypothetical protein
MEINMAHSCVVPQHCRQSAPGIRATKLQRKEEALARERRDEQTFRVELLALLERLLHQARTQLQDETIA